MTELKYPNKRTKIVCTIGPSSWPPDVMEKMIAAGMNVARINGAFADREEMLKVESLVRQFSDDVAMMIDIKGPEVRLNKFPQAIKLRKGQILEFGSSQSDPLYPANYPETYKKLSEGQMILVGDGDVRLVVKEIFDAGFRAEVTQGELLKPGKALNFPGLQLQDSPLTEKDIDLLEYAMERNWAFVSASFIRRKKDAEAVREKIQGSSVRLIAKIEDADGVDNIDEILEIVDGIMIARGGLGVDMGLHKIPVAEYKLLEAAKAAGKPAIVATQMLDSMEVMPFPTRAEANDVGVAILNGADCVMTSGETTAGAHPIKAVDFMSSVDQECEPLIKPHKYESNFRHSSEQVSRANKLFDLIQEKGVGCVVVVADDPTFVEILAKFNPKARFVLVVGNKPLARSYVSLVKGVKAAFSKDELGETSDAGALVTKLTEKGACTAGSKTLVYLENLDADFGEVEEIGQ